MYTGPNCYTTFKTFKILQCVLIYRGHWSVDSIPKSQDIIYYNILLYVSNTNNDYVDA